MTVQQLSSKDAVAYDDAWEDPLPHTFAPRRSYLRRLRDGGATDAVLIFLHGRGDSIDDMVGVFLPILSRRYGGTPSVLSHLGGDESDEQEEPGEEPANIAVIGLEARDNVWYPQSHLARGDAARDNAPYQYSALERLRATLVDVVFRHDVPPQRVAVVGFSQGAMLANAYVMSILQPQQSNDGAALKQTPLLPLPAHTLALAGSLFAEQAPFPWRRFSSADEETLFRSTIADEQRIAVSDEQSVTLLQRLLPRAVAADVAGKSDSDDDVSSATVRLLCGTADRFFTQSEIEQAAATIAQACTAASQYDAQQASSSPTALAHAAAKRLKVSVGFEPNAPHQITSHMMAATVAAVDAMLGRGGTTTK